MNKNKDAIFQFKITLKDIEPPIWRRVLAPSNYNFEQFHILIQEAMMWANYHLHEFRIPIKGSKRFVKIGIPDDEYPDEDLLDATQEKIADYFQKPNQKILYIYDFGDGWEHEIKLEKILLKEKGEKYPKCIAGERACPPEDCGGTGGYEDLLEILANPNHEEYRSMKTWAGDDFDPEYVELLSK
ncbi:MAG: plasmid pRiA4b ORF-3 family protein [Candidatus Margulisiibacteriota bacterium]|jgi:hypothetical protein